MRTETSCAQVRIARPTDKLKEVVRFYKEGLGLNEMGSFINHGGYNGIMLGIPDENIQFEFTEYYLGSPCPAPTKDNLLVFYFPERKTRDQIVNKLFSLGHQAVEPENTYWKANGVTIEDPDGWRIVLMHSNGTKIK